MLKSEQLDLMMVQTKIHNMQKVESKKLEAKLLDHSFIVRADESSTDRFSYQNNSGDEELTPSKVVSQFTNYGPPKPP